MQTPRHTIGDTIAQSGDDETAWLADAGETPCAVHPLVWLVADRLGLGCTVAGGDAELRAGYGRGGGEGVRIDARWRDAPAAFWCDAAAWTEWISPVLPVTDAASVPEALRSTLAAWTLAAPASLCDGTCLPHWPQGVHFDAADMPVETRITFTLTWQGRRLTLHFLEADASGLRECIDSMTPASGASFVPRLTCALAAGWSWLTPGQCDAVSIGQGVLLDEAADIAGGQCWCVYGRRAALIQMQDVPGGISTDVLAVADAGSSPHGGTAVRIVATLAHVRMALPDVAAWTPGMPLEIPAVPAQLVTLWRDGAPWAIGRLAAFDDRLAVRVENFVRSEVLA
ncbi:translocation protein in type III secretion [Pandoraea terrae]|uniref:Translocation protein in type III secretion n=1 Tax=Pandoraea terrae TaxID=1537710 RepID=A0A5E4ZCQ0_9BURK|nr:FliM/FliN family flagellar motor switch protein [Pandoraea terrae]VVE59151.1 translocation protein in type III secretion [Pandoraea terrae]